MVLACVEEWKVSALRDVALESRGITTQLGPCFWVCSLKENSRYGSPGISVHKLWKAGERRHASQRAA
jgi:hypothetical protein